MAEKISQTPKTIKMTEEEEEKFYALASRENACYYSLSAEVMNDLNLKDDKLKDYMEMMTDRLTNTLIESNRFLNQLGKKYGIKNGFKVQLDEIVPNPED